MPNTPIYSNLHCRTQHTILFYDLLIRYRQELVNKRCVLPLQTLREIHLA